LEGKKGRLRRPFFPSNFHKNAQIERHFDEGEISSMVGIIAIIGGQCLKEYLPAK
jgi:hypothetical protein